MPIKKKHDSGAKRRRSRSTLSESGKYFRDNPKASAKKNKYNRKARAKALANGTSTRSERAAISRKAKKNGKNIKGKDYDHAVGNFVSAAVNRGRAGEGGRKTGKKTKTR